MKIFEYQTIAALSRGNYKEKGSKFPAFAYPAETEEDIKTILETLKKQYHDATHHCFAYVLKPDKSLYRANDAGEPANSAGTPILKQIQSRNLTNILVVVIRYFGGTKLGVGGLINAYRNAAEAALDNARIITQQILQTFRIAFSYENLNKIMRILQSDDIKLNRQQYGENCSISFTCPSKLTEKVLNELHKISGVEIIIISLT